MQSINAQHVYSDCEERDLILHPSTSLHHDSGTLHNSTEINLMDLNINSVWQQQPGISVYFNHLLWREKADSSRMLSHAFSTTSVLLVIK